MIGQTKEPVRLLTNRAFVAILPTPMDTTRRVYVFCLLAVALWCSLILLAPVSKLAGFPPEIASALYGTFSRVCHQIPDRTLHLGTEPLGVCTRCTAVYFGFLASMVFLLFRKLQTGTMRTRWILLIAAAPMAIDVALSVSGIHASTTETRLITGILAGGVLPFYVIPPFLEAVRRLRVHHGDPLHENQA